MRKEATQRCGMHGRLEALRPWELRLIGLIMKVLCQCFNIVKLGCFRVDTDWIDCESAVPVLVRSKMRVLWS